MNQLDRIIEVTGRPSAEDIEAINSPFAATMLESLPPSNPRSLADMFPDAPPEALDCLKQLLQFNPNKRITSDKALEHPFVAQFHVPEEEPGCDHEIIIPIPDEVKSSIQEYRNRLYQDVIEHGIEDGADAKAKPGGEIDDGGAKKEKKEKEKKEKKDKTGKDKHKKDRKSTDSKDKKEKKERRDSNAPAVAKP